MSDCQQSKEWLTVVEFFQKLFDTSDFPARWFCGNWSASVGWLDILSDIATFAAYVAIPLGLIWFNRNRPEVKFSLVYWLFVAFIVSCGSAHLIEAIILGHPVYRLSGLLQLITAVVSWMTVVAIVRYVPVAMGIYDLIGSNRLLQIEIEERRAIEERLKSILNSMSEAVMVSDCDGSLELLNPTARNMFQFQQTDHQAVERSRSYALFSANESKPLAVAERPLTRAGSGESIGDIRLEVVCDVKRLRIPLSLTAPPVIDTEGKINGGLVGFRDVSLEKQVEEERYHQYRKLEQLTELAAVVAEATQNDPDDEYPWLKGIAEHFGGDFCAVIGVADEQVHCDSFTLDQDQYQSKAL